jgi:hypothetical protein
MAKKKKKDGIDYSQLAHPKACLLRDQGHLDWLRTLYCVACGRSPCDPAHVSIGGGGGKGIKAGDDCAVPLCWRCHRTIQHQRGERTFWGPWGGVEAAHDLGKALYAITRDTLAAHECIRIFRLRAKGLHP